MPGPINDLLKKDSISALTVFNKFVVGRLHVQLQQSLMHLSGLWYARRHRARTRFDRQTHQIIQASPGVRERHRNDNTADFVATASIDGTSDTLTIHPTP